MQIVVLSPPVTLIVIEGLLEGVHAAKTQSHNGTTNVIDLGMAASKTVISTDAFRTFCPSAPTQAEGFPMWLLPHEVWNLSSTKCHLQQGESDGGLESEK